MNNNQGVSVTHALILVGLLSISSYAAEPGCSYTELNVITDDGPPHMIKPEDSGIDLDITRRVLSNMCFDINVSYAPPKTNKTTSVR